MNDQTETAVTLGRQVRWLADHVVGAIEAGDPMALAMYCSQLYKVVSPDWAIGGLVRAMADERGGYEKLMDEFDERQPVLFQDMIDSGLWDDVDGLKRPSGDQGLRHQDGG